MKAHVGFILVIIALSHTGRLHADSPHYFGTWKLQYVSDVDSWVRYLEIQCSEFSLCEEADCSNALVGEEVFIHGDLIHLVLEDDGQVQIRIVLGGYVGDESGALFGTRYHYRDGKIISGLPMVYTRLTTN